MAILPKQTDLGLLGTPVKRSIPGNYHKQRTLVQLTHKITHSTSKKKHSISVSLQQGSDGLNISGHYHYAKEKMHVQNACNISYYAKVIDFSNNTVNNVCCATEPVLLALKIIIVYYCVCYIFLSFFHK